MPRQHVNPASGGRASPKHIAMEDLSIVIPFFNEGENVDFVLGEAREACGGAEIIAVDDGSADDTWERISSFSNVIGLRFRANLGQSAAIYHGLLACSRDYCGLMDGDGQNDPSDFRALAERLGKGDADVVCGYRVNRRDSWSRKTAAVCANAIRRAWFRDGIRDAGCSQKIFPRSSVSLLVPFRGLHRYLPAIFKRAGLRLAEAPVGHRPRRAGCSKYGNLSRAAAGFYDLVGVGWLLSRKLPPPEIKRKP